MKRILTAVSSVLIGLTAPALGQQNASGTATEAVNSLTQGWVTAYNRHDAARVASLYSEDTVRVTLQGILQGRDAVQRDIEDLIKAGGHDVSLTPKVIQPVGNLVWMAGEWSLKFSDHPAHGYYSGAITREGDGAKIKYDTYNMTPPAPAEQSVR